MSTPTATPSRLWLYFQETHGMVLTASEESDIRHAANAAAESDIRTLETELAAAKAERDLAITRLASILWSGAIDKHTCGDVQKWAEDYTAELARLRAENKQLKADVTRETTVCDTACMEAQRLRAEVERADVMYQRACEVEHELRAEVERLEKQIKDDNRSYGCELRDPNGTIWEQAAKDHARAERAEAECLEQARLLGKSGEREADLLGKLERLAKDKARLDWLEKNWIHWPITQNEETIRAAIDAAMKP